MTKTASVLVRAAGVSLAVVVALALAFPALAQAPPESSSPASAQPRSLQYVRGSALRPEGPNEDGAVLVFALRLRAQF